MVLTNMEKQKWTPIFGHDFKWLICFDSTQKHWNRLWRRKRRNHSPEFKAKVALAAAKGDKTVAELAQKYNLHANQISTWKKELLENAAMIFASESQLSKDNTEEVDKLHAKIGQLTMENDFLARVLGR